MVSMDRSPLFPLQETRNTYKEVSSYPHGVSLLVSLDTLKALNASLQSRCSSYYRLF